MSIEISFCGQQGDVFFCHTPFQSKALHGPEKRDELPLGPEPLGHELKAEWLKAEGQPTYEVVCGVDSSGFSGQMSKLKKGHRKKRHFPVASPASTLGNREWQKETSSWFFP